MIRLITIVSLLPAGFVESGTGQEAAELPVLVRSFAEVENPAPPFEDGKFDPRQGETIAFLGGTDTFNQQRFGYLEERIQLAWPDRELKVRNLGWQGDTIYYQARPRFFYTKVGDPQPGSSIDTRERTEPGIIVMNFGKLESLKGEESLPEFLTAYRELLEQLEIRTRRIVLVAPAPFFEAGPTGSLAEKRNEVLGQYIEGVRKLAEDRRLIFADGFTGFLPTADNPGVSSNGTHLSEAGQRRFAEIFAARLKFPASGGDSAVRDSLRQSIQRKNRLWHQYYHPTNWAFLFGDRQHVPASRDHEDTKKRWFLKEVDALPPLIADTEADIHRYAREAAKKR